VTRLRVMTFNIANAIDSEDDGDNAWVHRAPLNVATIKRYAPDVIGFQQCDEGNLATYRARPGAAGISQRSLSGRGRY
jgi:hypothetical protein